MNIPKEAIKKWAKRSGLGLAALAVLFFVGFSIWLFRPLKEVPPWKLMPSTTFSFFTFSLDQADPGVSALLEGMQAKLITQDTGVMKAHLFKKVFPSLIPTRLVGLVSYDELRGEPQILILVSMGKVIRLLKLAGGLFDRVLFEGVESVKVHTEGHSFKTRKDSQDGMRPTAYTIVGNNLLLGSNLSLLQDSYRDYARTLHGDAEDEYMSGLLLQASSQRGGSLCVDNTQGLLSKIFQEVEEKYSFAAFPSIDAVSTIMGDLRILPEELNGSLTFYCSSDDKLPEVRSDVKFIYGALRRKLRASDIDMKGAVAVQGYSVKFTFQIMDFMNALLKGEE